MNNRKVNPELLNKYLEDDVRKTLDQVRQNVDQAVTNSVDEYLNSMKAEVDALSFNQLPTALQGELNDLVAAAQADLNDLVTKTELMTTNLEVVKEAARAAGADAALAPSLVHLTESIDVLATAVKARKDKINGIATNIGKVAVKGLFGLIGL